MPAKSILVADDEFHMTYMLAHKLRQAGYMVNTASTGDEALQMAISQQPDLLITDFQIPGLTGLEVSLKLRENPETANTPVILLTARGHRVDQSEMGKTNIRQLVAKPFSMQELLDDVARVLASRVENRRTAQTIPAGVR